jgi:hypothetical protein
MKELKKSANWNIAATHYLTAGFVMPILVSMVGNIVIGALGITSAHVIAVLQITVYILSIWLGVMYAARYLRKTYIVDDKYSVIRIATIYFVVLHVGYIVLQFLLRDVISLTAAGITLVAFAVGAYLFNLFSKNTFKIPIRFNLTQLIK